jgi:uncharacterized membrane protein
MILPAVMLGISFLFMKHSPKKINTVVGYRTARSTTNQQTWQEANQYSARLFFRFSYIMILVAALCAVLLGIVLRGEVLMAVSMLVSVVLMFVDIIITVVFTEKHLKEMFPD